MGLGRETILALSVLGDIRECSRDAKPQAFVQPQPTRASDKPVRGVRGTGSCGPERKVCPPESSPPGGGAPSGPNLVGEERDSVL